MRRYECQGELARAGWCCHSVLVPSSSPALLERAPRSSRRSRPGGSADRLSARRWILGRSAGTLCVRRAIVAHHEHQALVSASPAREPQPYRRRRWAGHVLPFALRRRCRPQCADRAAMGLSTRPGRRLGHCSIWPWYALQPIAPLKDPQTRPPLVHPDQARRGQAAGASRSGSVRTSSRTTPGGAMRPTNSGTTRTSHIDT
jgi:hypothetical protein